MHKVITFLGIRPTLTQYSWDGKNYAGEVFAKALRQFWQYDSMLVLTTDGAKETSWKYIEELADPNIHCIAIPDGQSTEQMWKIFDIVIDQVAEDDTVTFDITHAFRSLPFLSFLFAAFLKTARKVHIQAILYGALEMSKEKGFAPVLDLTEFISMLDWITATDQFVQTGDAHRLARLLEPRGREKSASHKAAKTLRAISQAAFLCQPFDLMQLAAGLSPQLQAAQEDFAVTSKPFQVLSNQIETAFAAFANSTPFEDTPSMLITAYRLIDWYFSHGQLMQAVTLAREWLIDSVTWKLGEQLDYHRTPRSTMEYAISGLDQLGRPKKDDESGDPGVFTVQDLNEYGRRIHDTWSDWQNIRKLWSDLREVRNSLDHAGHQVAPLQLETIIKKSDKVCKMLQKLAQDWGIITISN